MEFSIQPAAGTPDGLILLAPCATGMLMDLSLIADKGYDSLSEK
jgi:hypothetical protein